MLHSFYTGMQIVLDYLQSSINFGAIYGWNMRQSEIEKKITKNPLFGCEGRSRSF